MAYQEMKTDAAGNLLVVDADVQVVGTITAQDTASVTTTASPVPGLTINRVTGTPTAGSAVTLVVSGESSFSLDVSGTWTGTLVIERSVDGATWTDIAAFVAGSPVTTKTITANAALHGNASAAQMLRVRATAWTSGTATVVIRTGAGVGTITVGNPVLLRKDSGRVSRTFQATFTAAATEALVTLTPMTDGVAGTAGTSFGVTTGKRLRLQSLSVTTRNAGTAGQGVVVNLRVNPTGAVTATSPMFATAGAGTSLAVANVVGQGAVMFPDGIDLGGTMQFGITQVGTATAGNTVTLVGFEI